MCSDAVSSNLGWVISQEREKIMGKLMTQIVDDKSIDYLQEPFTIFLKEKLDILQSIDDKILAITDEKDIEKGIEEGDLLRESMCYNCQN